MREERARKSSPCVRTPRYALPLVQLYYIDAHAGKLALCAPVEWLIRHCGLQRRRGFLSEGGFPINWIIN